MVVFSSEDITHFGKFIYSSDESSSFLCNINTCPSSNAALHFRTKISYSPP